MTHSHEKSHRQIMGVFDTADTMHKAVTELQTAGFNRSEMTLIANELTIDQKLGHIYRKTEDLENDPAPPRITYTSPDPMGDAHGAIIGAPMYVAAFTTAGVMVAAGGPMVATIAAIIGAGGAGAAIGGVFAKLFGKQHSDKVQKKLEDGGLLLAIRSNDDAREQQARSILAKYCQGDIFAYNPG
ncbi:hypothetical protein [Thalassospira mesophila]|uniref:General stress protein 17M-like domain-containing protein n=1 Tax=Thalassospira mesophila TaxID=1293891 RepID=A0A1Y2L0G4_9PROT|nr:hypothetical protein [Thalassospira mesophila]OSQ38741.1 hypothetical protein TMES_07985 [Thalassospira mesophila]